MSTTLRIAFVLFALNACTPPVTPSDDVVLVAPRDEPPRESDDAPKTPPDGIVIDELAPLPDSCAHDVAALFHAIDVEPRGMFAVRNDGALPFPRYTDAAENHFGIGEHFQGMQRVGDRLFLTGGVVNGPHMAQLIVLSTSAGDDSARVLRAHDLEPVLWHAGGFQIAEGIAAIPLAGDDDDAGEVRFYDVAVQDEEQDDEPVRELDVRIVRDHKLYAAAITRDVDGRFVVVTWDDEQLEVHRSLTSRLADGLETTTAIIDPDDVDDFQGGGCGLGCGTYQSINLVRECGDEGGGALFLVATRNTNKLAPSVDGDDLASLYALTLDDASASLSLMERNAFACRDRQCNFAAAAGIHVVDDERLALYSAYHWLQEDRVLFDEFTSP